MEKAEASLAGLSRFSLLADSDQALLMRVASARVAQRQLDLQYYLWDDDTTGKLLVYRVLEAARRGVQVRLLLDHANQLGRDLKWAALDAHPNIQVRLFNPFRGRFKYLLQWLYHAPQLNHRMHNKAWIVDGELAIVGGRNIGDHYFGVNPLTNFRDLDVFARGPIVAQTQAAFEQFWDSPLSLPIKHFLPQRERQAERVWRGLRRWRRSLPGYPERYEKPDEFYQQVLAEEDQRTVAAPAVLLFDLPDKATGKQPQLMGEQLTGLLTGSPPAEVLIEASYFIPGEDLVATLADLVARGSKVAVLTNSLATNDVLVAHAAYAGYRRDLLRAGVRLHELRPYPRQRHSRRHRIARHSKASLHTKAMVLDRQTLFVGSFNLDPRSLNLNTEMGYYLLSPQLAGQLADLIEEGLAGENSFWLSEQGGRLQWCANNLDGQPRYWQHDPRVSWLRRLLAVLGGWLPIERYL